MLKPEYAALYPGLRAGTWKPAAILGDCLLADCLLNGRGIALFGRLLLDEHFEFRGGESQGGEREGLRPQAP